MNKKQNENWAKIRKDCQSNFLSLILIRADTSFTQMLPSWVVSADYANASCHLYLMKSLFLLSVI